MIVVVRRDFFRLVTGLTVFAKFEPALGRSKMETVVRLERLDHDGLPDLLERDYDGDCEKSLSCDLTSPY